MQNIEDNKDAQIFYHHVIERSKSHIKRVITIAFQMLLKVDDCAVELKFGGSMFKNEVKNGKQEIYARRAHNHTARGRLAVRPLVVSFPLSPKYLQNLQSHRPENCQVGDATRKEEEQQWKEVRVELMKDMQAFLRRQIAINGVGAKTRIKKIKKSKKVKKITE